MKQPNKNVYKKKTIIHIFYYYIFTWRKNTFDDVRYSEFDVIGVVILLEIEYTNAFRMNESCRRTDRIVIEEWDLEDDRIPSGRFSKRGDQTAEVCSMCYFSNF